ncbi:MAG: pilus assembly protein PilM, partial [Casimicrobiaceae bacterium]
MLSAIAAQARDLTRRLGLAGFGRWWAQELWSFVPARAKDSIERRRARPVLVFDGKVATLWRPQVNGRLRLVESAKIPLDAGETSVVAAGRAALAAVARPGSPGAEVIVALPPRAVLRKTLTLPAAIEDDLRQALAFDLDRHTPFRADEIYFDAAVVDRDASRNALIVDLVAVRRAIVDPMLRHAENFGARVVAVVADPPERAAASRVNLLPDDRRTEASTWTRWRVVAPAALLAILALAALVLPLWQKRQEAIALVKVSEGARRRAEASEALRSELERKVGDYNFALQRKYAYPGTVQVLDDVTRILPDDTWLTQFEFHTGRGKDATRDIVLRGESANAGRLVALLQDSKLFTQAAPRSPTTKIQPGPGEIFDVGAQVVAAHAPEA